MQSNEIQYLIFLYLFLVNSILANKYNAYKICANYNATIRIKGIKPTILIIITKNDNNNNNKRLERDLFNLFPSSLLQTFT